MSVQSVGNNNVVKNKDCFSNFPAQKRYPTVISPAAPSPANLQQPKQDVVDIKSTASTPQGMSKKTKLAIAAGVGLAALGVIALVAKGRIAAAKLEAFKLAEHIDFVPAKTVEEAIDFGHTNLGIRLYTEMKDVTAINWIHEGLVNASNRCKGKMRMPNTIANTNLKDSCIATMSGYIKTELVGKELGHILHINEKFITSIDQTLTGNIEHYNKLAKGKDAISRCSDSDRFKLLLDKFSQNKANMHLNEKIELYETIENFENKANVSIARYKEILSKPTNKPVFTEVGLETDLAKIEKMSLDEKIKLQKDLSGVKIFDIDYTYEIGAPHNTIYHELGHLQHQYSCDTYSRLRTMEQYEKQFGKVTDETADFLFSDDKQHAASLVTWYAQTSPLEFVAEVYARLIAGRKMPEPVMNLYRHYNGPAVVT